MNSSGNTTLCIVARTRSSRLPRKVLEKVAGKSIVEHIIDNLKPLSDIGVTPCLCTTDLDEDKVLLDICEVNGILGIAGSELSIANRMLTAAEKTHAEYVIRVTGDNIFTDRFYLEQLVHSAQESNCDYGRVHYLPNGVTGEIMKAEALHSCYQKHDANTSEYMTLHMFDPSTFKTLVLVPEEQHQLQNFNLSIDTPEDLNRTFAIFEHLDFNYPFNLSRIMELVQNGSFPDAKIDTTKTVKLIDEVVSYNAYMEDLEHKISQSEKVDLPAGWYSSKFESHGS